MLRQQRQTWLFLLCTLAGLDYLFWPQQPTLLTIDYQRFAAVGQPDAPVQMLLVTDYRCPACRQFHQQVTRQLLAEEVAKGQLVLHYASYPVVDKDSLAVATALQDLKHQLALSDSAVADWFYQLPAEEQQPSALLQAMLRDFPAYQFSQQAQLFQQQQLQQQISYLKQFNINTLPGVVINQQLYNVPGLTRIRQYLSVMLSEQSSAGQQNSPGVAAPGEQRRE